MIERKDSLEQCAREHDVHITSDNLVCWKSDSKHHPQNWKLWSKLYTTLIVIWLEFYMTVLSSSGVGLPEKERILLTNIADRHS